MAVQNLVTEKKSVDNYPYGRLKCTMSFYVEFNPKKGYRACTQSINPKNGVLNKPKCSTYYDYISLVTKENGHTGFKHYKFRKISELNNFVANNTLELTPAENEHLLLKAIEIIRVDAIFAKFNDGFNSKDYLEAIGFNGYVQALKNNLPIAEIFPIQIDEEKLKDIVSTEPNKAEVIPHIYA